MAAFHPDERTLLNAHVDAEADDEDHSEDEEAYTEAASDDDDHKFNWNEEHSILAYLMEEECVSRASFCSYLSSLPIFQLLTVRPVHFFPLMTTK